MSGDAKLVALRVAQRGPPDVPLVLVVYDGGAEPHESLVASVEFAERLGTTKSVSVWKPIQLLIH